MFHIPARRIKEIISRHETKAKVHRFFTEIGGSARRVALFEAMIASLIVSMLAFAVGRFFLLPWYYALPAPIIYLAVRIVQIQRMDVLSRTEHLFPVFREQLITIRDNFTKTHEMEEALERDVLDRSHHVVASGFFDPRSFSTKIITMLLLFFVTGFFTQFTYQDVPPFWNVFFPGDDPNKEIEPNLQFWQRTYLTGPEDAADLNSSDEIFGDDDPLLEGVREVPIELQAARDALDLSTSRDVTETGDFERYRPTRIDAAGAEYYEETIPVSKHAVVQNYFRQEQ